MQNQIMPIFSNFFVEEYVRKFFDFKSHGLDIQYFYFLFD